MNIHFAASRCTGFGRVALTLMAGAVVTTAGWLGLAQAALIGSTFEISGPGCRFPDVAYGTISRKYLVVWADYSVGSIVGRFVAGDGTMNSLEFPISEAGFGALFPAVGFNAATNEFLVTWDDAGQRGGVIYGQRVRGTDGGLAGPNFPIGSLYGGIRSAVASSPNGYLVVYWGPGATAPEVYGRRVSAAGAVLGSDFKISNDTVFSGYPAIAYSSAGNQFLVTWDNEDGNIHGRRIDATTGSLLGAPIIVTTGGAKDRSCVAYDSVSNRWLVQFNDGANAGYSYDQFGRFVNADGTPSGGLIPLAHTATFEGDTQFGGDVAFEAGARRFFSSFGTDSGMGGQESLPSGAPVGSQITLGTGYYTSLNNAADTDAHRFLTAWEGLAGSYKIFGRLYAATISEPANFVATAQDQQNVLAWKNPSDLHFTGTMIRVKTTGYPTTPADGMLVVDKPGSPDASENFVHTGLSNWTTYYYSVFGHDNGPNYSLAAQAAATPRPLAITLGSSDFAADAGGWALASWQAGSLAPGTIARDAVAGNIVSTGSGQTNNNDACTREGGQLTKVISTAGRQNIQVEYDVMARLNTPPAGAPIGSCAVLDHSSEDKLVVFYSTTGIGGPWTAAQTLSEGVELPTDWTHKSINLAGVPDAGNNPDFALRFQWQFNSEGDSGRLDNIRVFSGGLAAPSPAIGFTPEFLDRTVEAGRNLPNDVLKVRNAGEGLLDFNVAGNLPWLVVSPTSSTSAGPDRLVTITYGTATLAVGDHEGIIELTSPSAVNSPQRFPVRLHVVPPACFREPFSYYDGSLTETGAAMWAGNATDQLTVNAGALKIQGGGGSVTAGHAVSCAGSGGVIGVQLKVKKGTGSGDFFWSIYIDDTSGDPGAGNFGRWYGGSTLARGRIGTTTTPDMVLSGVNTWDDLYLKINTAANSSEFFFNGVLYGTLNHGPSPTTAVGAIRIERLDRTTAGSDFIMFDDLTVGSIDSSLPRLTMSRTGGQLLLAWPASGIGSTLQSTSDLATWTPIAGPFVITDGKSVFSVPLSPITQFFRLRKP